MFPPLLMYLRIGPADRPAFGLWLPLFLVWLILLPIVALVLVATMLVDVVLFLAGQRYYHYTLLTLRCLALLGATRGMVVSIRSKEASVDVEMV